MDLDSIIKSLLLNTLDACKLIHQAKTDQEKEEIYASINFTHTSQQLIMDSFFKQTPDKQEILLEEMEIEIEKKPTSRIKFGPGVKAEA